MEHTQRPALTGIRGIAALWVIAFHMHKVDFPDGPVGALLLHGYMAVDLFFVLSGFVMAMTYKAQFDRPNPLANYWAFISHRVARIYPLYAAVISLMVIGQQLGISWPNHLRGLPLNLPLNLMMVQNWGFDSYSIVYPAWSISVEFAAYLAFPVLLLAAFAADRRVTLCFALGCAVMMLALIRAPTPADVFTRTGLLDIPWNNSPWPLVRCAAEFSIGLLTYRLAGVPLVQVIFRRGWVTLLTVAAGLLLLTGRTTDPMVVALMPPLILGVSFGRGIVVQALSCAPAVVLGQLSYAIYLLHAPVMHFAVAGPLLLTPLVGHRFEPIATELLILGVLLGASWVAHTTIEKPARKLIRRWLEPMPGMAPGARPAPSA